MFTPTKTVRGRYDVAKSLICLQGKKIDDTTPVQYGITHDLEQFVRSLTYSTFRQVYRAMSSGKRDPAAVTGPGSCFEGGRCGPSAV